MRGRIWAIVAIVVVLAVVTACGAREARGPANTPVPTKTLRPTFTATAPKPTLAPTATPEVAAATVAPEPTAAPPTAEPPTPTAEPSPTPEPATFTVASASLNVRSGPGTNFGVIGRLTNGQRFPISGKNDAGTWWEFDYNGRKGWVVGSNVRTQGAEQVQVAQTIPVAPTAAPRPTARPQPVQPAQPKPVQPPPPAAAATKYGQTKSPFRMTDTNDWVTIYCMLWNKGVNDLLPGTIRISRDGQVVSEKAFTKFGTWYLNYPYNDGCKIEIRPAANGNYTAVLIEGGNPVSDPVSFAVTGQGDRITFLEWKEK